ncbi:MAG: c-type cytochrome [Hyphomicrobiales bacterium]
MDAYEFNKIAGAILGSVLLVLGVQNLSDIIYATHAPSTPAYVVEGAEEAAGGEAAEEQPKAVPISQMLAEADAGKGQAAMKKCGACHTWEKGGKKKIGPNLYDILGRPAGSVEGFKYSNGMQARAGEIGTWTYDTLGEFLAGPKKYIKGTSMAFAGVKKATPRAEMIMFLRGQSDTPVDLPAATAPAAEPAAAATETEPAAAATETEPATTEPAASE